MDVPLQEKGVFAFGPFRLDPVRRTLSFRGSAVTLTARLFDTLHYFLQNPEKLLERQELEQAIWPGRVVEDGNLQKAVWSLRKALQDICPTDTYIVTVPSRGFRFAVPVEWIQDSGAPPALTVETVSAARTGWTASRSRVIGGVIAVSAGLAILLVLLGIKHNPKSEETPPPPYSVAVMAFTNLSGDPNQEYFSDGLSEELIDSLGRIGSLRVPARLSSFSFKGRSVPIRDIARELNVGTVLEGSVRRSGGRLRVTAQLIDAESGYQIWSNSYDSSEGDALRIQADIAASVTKALQVTIVGDDAAKLALGGTTSAKAFDAYLRGMKLHNDGSPDSLHPALAAFNEALAIDPNYALAHVRRISTMIMIAQGVGGSAPNDPDPKAAFKSAVAEARQVVSLAPALGPAHTILGNALELTGNMEQAGIAQNEALKLAPGDSWVNNMYAIYEGIVGNSSAAIAAAKRGVELDPLSAEAYFNLGQELVEERKPEEALQALNRAEELGTSRTRLEIFRTYAVMEAGNAAAALNTCASASASDGIGQECLAIEYHRLGRQADAEQHLAKLKALFGDDYSIGYTEIYAQWGQLDNALHWLEVAYAQNPTYLIDIETRWTYDPLRELPRFKEIERRMQSPR